MISNKNFSILTFLGFLIITWIIWVRFIRERLSKELPFNLSEVEVWLIVYIIFIYALCIALLIFPSKK